DRSAKEPGDRPRDHEQAGHPAAMTVRKPVGEVKNDSGIKAGLERPEQDSQEIEHARRLDEHHRDAGTSPQQRDPRKRLTRADLLEQEVAGNLEEQIT